MEKMKQIIIKVSPWMAKAALSAALFIMSFAMASIVPRQDPSFIQVLCAIFACIWALGSVVLAIIAVAELWGD